MNTNWQEIKFINVNKDNFKIWAKDNKGKVKEKEYEKKKKEPLVDFVTAVRMFEEDFDKEK